MSNNDKNYLIIDIGTGNVRAALTNSQGEILGIERDNVSYYKDEKYPEALGFGPNELWRQILSLSKKVLANFPHSRISAITVSSQREGIVLLDKNHSAILGLPNHDHRGRQWESSTLEKDYIYSKSGRYPSSIFSALKLVGLREGRPDIYKKMHTFLSISDWTQFMFCGVKGYEHSQASETLLYEVEAKQWSEKLCDLFGIDRSILPPLHSSGKILGPVLPEIAQELGLPLTTKVIVGGSDTQLAIKSTSPKLEDVILVAGTTTPVVKVTADYIIDPQQKTWTNRNIDPETFIFETNAGVTGLNYMRLKEIFYPREEYAVIEEELGQRNRTACTASLGSLIADEDKPLTRGGFIFETPISQNLSRADFVWAAFMDIACCISENYDYLCAVSPHNKEYIWGCGGGFQSKRLTQLMADLLGKEIRIREGFQHASIIGAIIICNEALDIPLAALEEKITVIVPNTKIQTRLNQKEWKAVRTKLKNLL